MARFRVSTNHRWLRRQVQIDGRTSFHRQCLVCRRDFARASDDAEWRAVHVGDLEFDLLNEETTRRWVSEDCPGRPLPGEENCRRIQPGGEVYGSYQTQSCLAEKSLDLETGPSGAKLTAGEVAKLLKVHLTTVYKMAKRSELPGFKIASDWRFDPAQIQGWIRSRIQRPEG
jgi:excisionase family DNA binding protein